MIYVNRVFCDHDPMLLDQTGVCLCCGAVMEGFEMIDRDPAVEEDDDDDEDQIDWLPDEEDDDDSLPDFSENVAGSRIGLGPTTLWFGYAAVLCNETGFHLRM